MSATPRPARSAGDPEADATAVPGAETPDGIGAERAALWSVERGLWAPRTVRAGGGTALTASRPHTAYRKIVDVVAPDAAAFRSAVAAAAADRGYVGADRPEPLLVRFEEHPAVAPLDAEREAALRALGFTRDPDPVPSVPSTRPGDPARVRVWSRWLAGPPERTAPYYGQTTDVTCGAVTALMMFEGAGAPRFGADGDENQAREIAFWRSATNLPACEPVGLAVATAREIAATGAERSLPRVVLSAPDLVLLEWFERDPDELRLRTQLQRDGLRQAERLGVPVERRWMPAEEIRELVAGGDDVFLLITLDPLIGDPTPHWVLAHDVVGDAVIVSDPWVEAAHGETWADTSALPVPVAGIDRITRWGDPEYRGVVVVPRATARGGATPAPA